LGKMYIDNINAPIYINSYRSNGCELIVRNIDLNNDYKKNIITLDKSNVPKVDLIICNFALHYMLFDEYKMENIIGFISHYLNEGGEFIFTALDGAKVYKLLKENENIWKKDKYMIEFAEKLDVTVNSNKFNGFEKINVLLPCSDKPYEEPLINLFELDKAFKKYNIKRTETRNFDHYLREFKETKKDIYEGLNKDDKEFIGLYNYAVYKK
jgi:hypothetical protein